MVDILLQLMEICDLISISDGSKGYRYAVAYAKRSGDLMDYNEGDDLQALLEVVLLRVS